MPIRITGRERLYRGLSALPVAVMAALEPAAHEIADKLGEWGRDAGQHTWLNQTGDTTLYTNAHVESINEKAAVILLQSIYQGRSPGHSGGAGKWIELAAHMQAGGFPWLIPTVERHFDEIIEIIQAHELLLGATLGATIEGIH